jgi:hypothetical protein
MSVTALLAPRVASAAPALLVLWLPLQEPHPCALRTSEGCDSPLQVRLQAAAAAAVAIAAAEIAQSCLRPARAKSALLPLLPPSPVQRLSLTFGGWAQGGVAPQRLP